MKQGEETFRKYLPLIGGEKNVEVGTGGTSPKKIKLNAVLAAFDKSAENKE